MQHNVKYSCESDGTTSTLVEVPTGFNDTESRQLDEGDRVFVYGSLVTPSHGHMVGAVYGVIKHVKNGELVAAPKQPEPGDIVACLCSVDDVSFLAGSTGVILEDGSLRGIWGSGISALVAMGPPPSS